MSAPTAPNAAQTLSWDKAEKPFKSVRKKQNPLTVVAVVAIVILGFSGMWRATHQEAPSEWVKVVAASTDIPAGTRLSFTSLRYVQFPKQFLPRDMATSLTTVEGNVTRSFIPQGEPIRPSMVFDGRRSLAKVLETHERAITLQLPDDALVDHSIEPDDRVDLLVVSSKNGDKYTKTICQDARVLIAASKLQSIAKRGGSADLNKITLAVTADVAEQVTEAAEVGKIRLVLRNRLGRTVQHLFGADQNDLLPADAFKQKSAVLIPAPPMASALPSLPPPPVPFPLPDVAAQVPPGPIEWVVDIFAGGKKESVSVPAN